MPSEEACSKRENADLVLALGIGGKLFMRQRVCGIVELVKIQTLVIAHA